MRDWLLANAFFAGMLLLAAALLAGGIALVRFLQIDPELARSMIGWIAVIALIATGLIARYILRRIERR